VGVQRGGDGEPDRGVRLLLPARKVEQSLARELSFARCETAVRAADLERLSCRRAVPNRRRASPWQATTLGYHPCRRARDDRWPQQLAVCTHRRGDERNRRREAGYSVEEVQ